MQDGWGIWWQVYEWAGYIGVGQTSVLLMPNQSVADYADLEWDHMDFDPLAPDVEDPQEYYYTYQMLGAVPASAPGYWTAFTDHYKLHLDWWGVADGSGGFLCPNTWSAGVCATLTPDFQFTSDDEQEVL